MKKHLFFLFVIFNSFYGNSQPLGNEWIKPNQTYYKIKIAQQGVFKIDSATLIQFGVNLNGINPNKFQIFKNGEEVSCFVKGENDGVFNADDYLLFYGNKNDGVLDAELYKNATDQPHQLNSLYTDTAIYFFTILPSSVSQIGKRFVNFNETNYSAYSPESYFIKELQIAPIEEYFRGTFSKVGEGEFYYFSDYLGGESWLGNRFGLNENKTYNLNTTNLFNSGPNGVLETKVFGVSDDKIKTINHHLNISISNNNLNFNLIKDTTYAGYTETKYSISLSNSLLGNSTQIKYETIADLGLSSDYSALSYLKLKYAHSCDFSNISNMHFKHIGQQSGNRIYFQFLNYPKINPVVLDLTNNKKINCTVNSNVLKVIIENTLQEQEFYFYDESEIIPINSMELVDMNVLNPNLNTEFLIISNKQLSSAAEAYKTYRAQRFNTSLVYSNNLYNQFFYGYEHPLAIKHFLKYIYQNQTIKPTNLLLLGRGYQNNLVRSNFQDAYSNNLVPAIGEPSSDNLYTTGLNSTIIYAPAIPTGRVPAANNEQAFNYLNKLIEYEKDTIVNNDWRKQVLHLTGGSGNEQQEYTGQLNIAKNKIKDVYFGANVTSFNKNTTQNVEVGLKSKLIAELNNGKSLMTFLGHGSLSILDVDFGSINDMQNTNKYTFFYFNGCNIGNANDADPLGSGNIYGKDFLTAANKGAIGWLAHSNFTLTGPLYQQISLFYKNLGTDLYGNSIGKIIQQTIAESSVSGGVYEVSHGLQLLYQGDPALKIGSPYFPDYKITDADIFLTDKNLTALADSFEINAIIKNIGKAITDSILIKIEHTVSATGNKVIYDSIFMSAPFYSDTLKVKLKGLGKNWVGENVFKITVDYLNLKTEGNELNNEAVFKKFIPGSGIILMYPLNYEIVSTDSVEFIIQNNDLLALNKEYIFEIDNSTNFNNSSIFYRNSGVVLGNDIAKWKIKLPTNDTIVYYWRAKINAPENQGGTWINASFTKISNAQFGFMQSEFNQFNNVSAFDKIVFDSIKKQMEFVDNELVLGIQNKRFDHRNMGVIVPYQLNEGVGSCTGNNVVAMVFEPFQVDVPYEIPGYPFNCAFVQNNKQNRSRRYYPFPTNTFAELAELRRFIDSIPSGYYVAMFSRYGTNIQAWDQATLNSLNKFGLTKVNQIKSKNTAWAFISMKDAAIGFAAEDSINNDSLGALVDMGMVSLPPAANQPQDTKLLTINKALITKWYKGSITSKPFGPAKNWSQLNFKFIDSEESINSKFNIDVIGINNNGNDTIIYKNITNTNFDLSAINNLNISYLKLKLNMEDSAKRTPQYFGYWQLLATPIAEAKLAPEFVFSLNKNPIEEGDSLFFQLGIQNISSVLYDSSTLNIKIIDDNRIIKHQQNLFIKSLNPKATSFVKASLPTLGLNGNNQIQFTLNYDKKVNELTFLNNFLATNFIVNNDRSNPFINVTFDGVNIMNGDIVSATPLINISSIDNNKYILQNDTSLFNLMIRKPGSFDFEKINLNSSEIQYFPAIDNKNNAKIIFKPQNLVDGKYALKVQAIDAVGNKAGENDYEIEFTIINKSTISNFFPYPNPATTNIRFVFTLTGSKVPDDLLIRISTITGKVVKEITKLEFGNIKIGNNISEYAWDGNDMYGDRLANGVYLYQVFTRIDNKAIENIKSFSTEKYFTDGVGKIYLMR